MVPDYTRWLNTSTASREEELFAGLYAELHRIAQGRMAAESPATTASAPQKTAPSSQEDTSRAQQSQDRPDSATVTPLAPAGSTTGMWAVQLGSFSNPQNAEKLAADLRAQGFAAFLSQLSTSSGELHRVRVGPQKDREAAEAMAARLQQVGHTGRILPHP